MADFYVTMPRNMTVAEVAVLEGSRPGVDYAFSVREDGPDPPTPLRIILVRGVADEDAAKGRVVELLGLGDEEAAQLTVRLAAQHPA
jgi:hypothetical protein